MGDLKLLRNPQGQQGEDWQLFNLAEDISESRNLAASQPNKLAPEPAHVVADWLRRTDA